MNPNTFSSELPLWSFQFKSASRVEILSRKDIEIKLITKALRDEMFKTELLRDAKATIQQQFDIELPSSLMIKAVAETEKFIYLVLPHNPYAGISEEELMTSLAMTYEDVAQCVLEQKRNVLFDEESSAKVVARAWKDELFKQELVSHPMTIINKECNIIIPADVQITVFVESPSVLYIVLPHLSNVSLVDLETAPDPDVRHALVGASFGTGISTCVNCGPVTCFTGLAGSCTCV